MTTSIKIGDQFQAKYGTQIEVTSKNEYFYFIRDINNPKGIMPAQKIEEMQMEVESGKLKRLN